MKTKYVSYITFAALASILILQGLWFYNTYKLVDAEFNKKISTLFISSLENEALLRSDDPIRKSSKPDTTITFKGNDDLYTLNRLIQEVLYKANFPPVSLEKLDSIFNDEVKNSSKLFSHSFVITDSLGNQKQIFTFGNKDLDTHYGYKETIKLRNVDPEYITLTIPFTYKVGFIIVLS